MRRGARTLALLDNVSFHSNRSLCLFLLAFSRRSPAVLIRRAWSRARHSASIRLPYKLAYKAPLRYKPPRLISPLLAKVRCKICMAHRPSTIVNPFAISPLREVICLARPHRGALYASLYGILQQFFTVSLSLPNSLQRLSLGTRLDVLNYPESTLFIHLGSLDDLADSYRIIA